MQFRPEDSNEKIWHSNRKLWHRNLFPINVQLPFNFLESYAKHILTSQLLRMSILEILINF